MTRPIYLMADSQLLFWKSGELPFIHATLDARLGRPPRAVYIGASNGDVREYFEIFETAMQAIGVADCRMIHSTFSSSDRAFLGCADIVMLAGGDAARGWRVIEQTGMKDLILERYRAGATLVGLSAGAVQLGLFGLCEGEGATAELFETFQLCPFVVIAHGEDRAWSEAGDAARLVEKTTRGVGIPHGGGLIVHADGRVEAVRRPAHDFLLAGGAVVRHVLIPVAG